MNAPATVQPDIYAPLKPTWRQLWAQLRVLHSQAANRRAERLVLRYMERTWCAAKLEGLLERLIARDSAPRQERTRHQGVSACN